MKLRIAIALVLLALALGCITERVEPPLSNIYNNSGAGNGTGQGNASGAPNATNVTDTTPITNLTNTSAPNITNATNGSTNPGTNASMNASMNESGNPGAPNCTANLLIYYFHSDYCPYSASTAPFIDEVERNFTGRLCIERFETGKNRDNLRLFYELSAETKFPEALQGVPTIFINGTYITGAGGIRQNLERSIEACLSQNCTGPAGR